MVEIQQVIMCVAGGGDLQGQCQRVGDLVGGGSGDAGVCARGDRDLGVSGQIYAKYCLKLKEGMKTQ